MKFETSWKDPPSEWIDRKKIIILKDDKGSTLIVSMIILLLLTIIGTSSIETSIVEQKITRNHSFHKIAFFAADSGIEYGRVILNDLKKSDSGSWDDLLANNTINSILDSGGGRNVGDATFSLAIRDNDDLDSNTLIDIDNIIILTSTVDYNGAVAEIETYIHYLGGSSDYAQEHYDAKSSGHTGDESAAVSNNVRW